MSIRKLGVGEEEFDFICIYTLSLGWQWAIHMVYEDQAVEMQHWECRLRMSVQDLTCFNNNSDIIHNSSFEQGMPLDTFPFLITLETTSVPMLKEAWNYTDWMTWPKLLASKKRFDSNQTDVRMRKDSLIFLLCFCLFKKNKLKCSE